MSTIKIGTWIEPESREVQRGTSYAADYIIHETVPGEYDAFLVYERSTDRSGVEHVSSKSISVTIPTNIVGGQTFSGFGGVNYASTDVKTGPSKIHLNPYCFMAKDLVETGSLELLPEFGFLANPWGLDRNGYLDQSRQGLYNYFGLDAFAYAKTDWFAEKLASVIKQVETGGEWAGWDINYLVTAKRMDYIFFGNIDDAINLTHKGREFLKEYLD